MRRKAESEKILPEPSPPTFAAAPLFFFFIPVFFLSPLFPLRSVLRPSVRPSVQLASQPTRLERSVYRSYSALPCIYYERTNERDSLFSCCGLFNALSPDRFCSLCTTGGGGLLPLFLSPSRD